MSIATTNTLVMTGQSASSIISWVKGATVTTSDTSVGIGGVQAFYQATLFLSVTAASGTSPTLDIYIQKMLADRITFQDIVHFTQVTSAPTKRVANMVTGGNKEEAQQTNTLAAGTINAVPFGTTWRVSAVVGGTSPSFTFDLYMEGLS